MSDNLKYKLLNHQEMPPQGIWESIALKLDEEDKQTSIVQSKMLAYEVMPPVKVWESITLNLDEEDKQTTTVQSKMLAYEVIPPVSVWENITNGLDQVGAKIVKLSPKTKQFSGFRLRAAAAALILVISGFWLSNIFRNNGDTVLPNTIVAHNKVIEPQVTSPIKNDKSVLPYPETQEKKLPGDNPSFQSNQSVQSKDLNPDDQQLLTVNQVESLTKNPFDGKSEKFLNGGGDNDASIDLVNSPNTYITIVGPDGQSARLSTKFSKQVNYFTDRSPESMENIDFIIKESVNWRKKIAGWRAKLNKVSLSPSISNFMDVIELSKVLSEKKN